jgi:glutathione S-transferase
MRTHALKSPVHLLKAMPVVARNSFGPKKGHVVKLYYSPGACSLAPHIILREIGHPFDLVKVDTGSHKTPGGGDFYAINPKGCVPVLELENGERLTEGPIIAQYLCDQAGRSDLMPAFGSFERYRVLEWQNYITSELHKSFSPLFNSLFDTNAKALHASGLRKKFGWVSEVLGSKAYLCGGNFTAADAYLFTVTSWARHVDLNLSSLTNLQGHVQRVAARPAVQMALSAEGLLK